MATFDLRVGDPGFPVKNRERVFVLEREFDATEQVLAQNDIVQLLDIPANTVVLRVGTTKETLEGGAATAAIGDATSATGFIAAMDCNSATPECTALALTEAAPNTVTGYSNGKFYAAAGVIQLKALAAGGLVNFKGVIRAVCVDLS
jgi:hypothetical protein